MDIEHKDAKAQRRIDDLPDGKWILNTKALRHKEEEVICLAADGG